MIVLVHDRARARDSDETFEMQRMAPITIASTLELGSGAVGRHGVR
jgi:hypothetical protein